MWLTDALVPARCPGCDRHTSSVLCNECQAFVIGSAQPAPRRVGSCPVFAAFPYDGPVRRILHTGKYRFIEPAVVALAEMSVSRLSKCRGAPLVPIPLTAARQTERGFNQAQTIARVLASRQETVVRSSLGKTRRTSSQVGKVAEVRRTNLVGAFAWEGEPLDGIDVCLVDDVITTGATMAAAAEAVRQAGATTVAALALAMVA